MERTLKKEADLMTQLTFARFVQTEGAKKFSIERFSKDC